MGGWVGGWVAHVILVSAQVLLVLTLGLWTLGQPQHHTVQQYNIFYTRYLDHADLVFLRFSDLCFLISSSKNSNSTNCSHCATVRMVGSHH